MRDFKWDNLRMGPQRYNARASVSMLCGAPQRSSNLRKQRHLPELLSGQRLI